jgi:hypothetical protein
MKVLTMTADQFVTCETVAAIVLHVRRVTDIPVRLTGHSTPRPRALCGRPVDWDTQRPVAIGHITCRDCKAALAAELGLAVPGETDATVGPLLGPVRRLCERCGERPAISHRPGPARCTECADEPAPRKPDRRRSRPRARTISRAKLRREVRLHAEVTPTWAQATERPRTRGECREQERPCPWVGCRHHLYLEATEAGGLKLNFPDLEPWELQHTCALDVAERGGITLEEVGEIMNITRERTRQLEVRGLVKLKMASPSPDEPGADLIARMAALAREVLR